MGGLLQQARRFFRGFSPPESLRPQSYQVACPDGHRLYGQRTGGYQALRCPTCGEGIFVLPRSPLPEPAADSRPAAVGPAAARAVADEAPVALTDPTGASVEAEEEALDEVEWVDEAEPSPAVEGADPVELALAERPVEAPGGEVPARPARRRAAAAAVVEAAEGPVGAEPVAPRRSARNRNAWVFGGVAALVVATVVFRTWRARWQDFPRVAERGRIEGLAALDAGEFDRANQLLSEARRAVESLGDAYQGAEAIRQGAKEAAVIVKLAAAPLEEMLDEASRSDAEEWRKRFETYYKGSAIILEARVAAVPRDDGSGRYELDYRVLPDGEGGEPKSRGEIDLRGFRLFDLVKPKVGDVVTVGARLASFQFDEGRSSWAIGLEPESGVTMTHRKALAALRGTADAEPVSNDEGP